MARRARTCSELDHDYTPGVAPPLYSHQYISLSFVEVDKFMSLNFRQLSTKTGKSVK